MDHIPDKSPSSGIDNRTSYFEEFKKVKDRVLRVLSS